jgi:zinc protease
MDVLGTMSSYGFKADYIKKEEDFVKALTVEKQLKIINKYIDPAKMYYVVVGDAKTQLDELEKAGLGKPILVK